MFTRRFTPSIRATTLLLLASLSATAQHHSADTTPDQQLSLSELLRVIQFFNTRGLHCMAGTEDGYAPGPDAAQQSCAPHDSDYLPQDWEVNLTELLRAIQVFNSRGYHTECGTEDNFAPGMGSLFDCSVEGEGEGEAEGGSRLLILPEDLTQMQLMQASAASAMGAAIEQRTIIPPEEQTGGAFTLMDQIEGLAELNANFINGLLAKDGDISSLVAIVMFEAWEQEEELLREMLDEMQDSNEAMAELRRRIQSYQNARESVRAAMRQAYENANRQTILEPDLATRIDRHTEYLEVIVTGNAPGSVSIETFGGPLEVTVICPPDIGAVLTIRDMINNTQLSQSNVRGTAAVSQPISPETYHAIRLVLGAQGTDGVVPPLTWFKCQLEITYPILVLAPPWTPVEPRLSTLQGLGAQLSRDTEELRTEILGLSNPPGYVLPQVDLDLLADIQAIMASGINGFGLFLPHDLGAVNALLADTIELLGQTKALSEMTTLRLQMTMDRRSRFIQTLSNIMTKMADTEEDIIQNIK